MNWPEIIGLVAVNFITFTFLSILVINTNK